MLHIKYRPKEFSEVMGNHDTVEALTAIVARPRKEIPHAFLLTGPSGCGKTTLGRILAKELGASKDDFHEVDAADMSGVDMVRNLRRQMRLRPISSTCRVWLLDECHALSKNAQDILLKALEDTPKHVYFILATTDPQKLIGTVKNRCVPFAVKSLEEERIYKLLRRVCKKEELVVPKAALEKIAQYSLGSPRQALVVLDKVKDMDEGRMEKAILKAAEEESQTIELCRALLKAEPWRNVAAILKGLEQDPEQVRLAVLGYMSSVLLGGKDNPQAALVIDCFREPFYNIGKPGLVHACYTALLK